MLQANSPKTQLCLSLSWQNLFKDLQTSQLTQNRPQNGLKLFRSKQDLWNGICSLLRRSKNCQWDTCNMVLLSVLGSSNAVHIKMEEENDVLSQEWAPAARANNKRTHCAQWMKCEISSVISTHATVNQAFLRGSAHRHLQLFNLRPRQEHTGPCPTHLHRAKWSN